MTEATEKKINVVLMCDEADRYILMQRLFKGLDKCFDANGIRVSIIIYRPAVLEYFEGLEGALRKCIGTNP